MNTFLVDILCLKWMMIFSTQYNDSCLVLKNVENLRIFIYSWYRQRYYCEISDGFKYYHTFQSPKDVCYSFSRTEMQMKNCCLTLNLPKSPSMIFFRQCVFS